MKYIKWKSLIITVIVCLLPILMGVALWDILPDTIAIHFNLYNEPDNYASKGFAVFGIPLLMAALQIFCCIVNDINAKKHTDRNNFETITKWIIPIMSIVLQIITIGYNLGWAIDIRCACMIIVGILFLVTGCGLSKLDYIKNYNIEPEKAQKINRFVGYETVVMGLLSLISTLFPPVMSFIWLILLIPYTAIGIWYGISVYKKQNI